MFIDIGRCGQWEKPFILSYQYIFEIAVEFYESSSLFKKKVIEMFNADYRNAIKTLNPLI